MHGSIPSCLAPPADGTPWAPPLDAADVVIRLEAAGVTDAVARRDYGAQGIWNLAESCLASQSSIPSRRKKPPAAWFLGEYLKGVSFAVPLLLCSLAMIWFRYSLWGGNVSADMAGAAGLGTIASFIVAGGFVHAMAVCRRWTRYAAACLALTGLLFVAFSRFYDFLAFPFDLVAAGFHLILGLLWLGTGILHMLERNLWSAAATAAGILIVVLLHQSGIAALVIAQFLGLAAATALTFAICHVMLRRRRGKDTPRQVTLAADIYYSWPHFLYGALYYALVFSDRLLSWTVPDTGSGTSVQFRGDYETALDIALVGFILQVGIVRPCGNRFFHHLSTVQDSLKAGEHIEFVSRMKRAYWATSFRITLFMLTTSVCLWILAWRLPLGDVKLLPLTLIGAIVGNALLVFALWNTSLLFRLSQPVAVVNAIAIGVGADLATGYLATRLGSYPDAVLGFVIGTLLFALLSTFSISKRLQSLDYYHFSAAA
jgi:hypothetical protein